MKPVALFIILLIPALILRAQPEYILDAIIYSPGCYVADEDFMKAEPFVMYLGDNILKNGIKSFVDEFSDGKFDSQILLARVPNPREFGVAELDGDRVVALEEKPKVPKSDYALVGVYMFTESIFTAVEQIKPSFRNELQGWTEWAAKLVRLMV